MRTKSSVRIVITIIMKVVPLIRLRLSTRYLQLSFYPSTKGATRAAKIHSDKTPAWMAGACSVRRVVSEGYGTPRPYWKQVVR
jgi:hypothetical protein